MKKSIVFAVALAFSTSLVSPPSEAWGGIPAFKGVKRMFKGDKRDNHVKDYDKRDYDDPYDDPYYDDYNPYHNDPDGVRPTDGELPYHMKERYKD